MGQCQSTVQHTGIALKQLIGQLEKDAENFINDIQSAAWNNTKELTHKTIGSCYPKKIKELVLENKKKEEENGNKPETK
mgnify:CR=1 FL=1